MLLTNVQFYNIEARRIEVPSRTWKFRILILLETVLFSWLEFISFLKMSVYWEENRYVHNTMQVTLAFDKFDRFL